MAEKCPVCKGKTTVRKGFYEDMTTICKACNGRGVVFSPYNYQSVDFQPFTQPHPWPAIVTSDTTTTTTPFQQWLISESTRHDGYLKAGN